MNHVLTAPDTLLNKNKTPARYENKFRVTEELQDEEKKKLGLKKTYQYQ